MTGERQWPNPAKGGRGPRTKRARARLRLATEAQERGLTVADLEAARKHRKPARRTGPTHGDAA